MNLTYIIMLCALLRLSSSAATVIYVKSATLAGVTLQDQGGLPLDGGGIANGDGALLEFGYYSLASAATPFSGAWNALTGPDSPSLIATTIGDGFSGADGIFTLSFNLDSSLQGLPPAGTPLAIRFYNSTSRASSTAFNAVANTNGLWNSNLSAVQIPMGVGSEPGTVWQDGAGSAFRTTIPVPEPSGALMVLGGAAAWCLQRRRS